MIIRMCRKFRGLIYLAAAAAALAMTLLAASPAQAASHPPRYWALHWAEQQAGKPYIWGGTGPGGFDCSGLVYRTYHRLGYAIPRTTFGMAAWGRLVREKISNARPGDILFYGPGHVELKTAHARGSFGALEPGTLIGWHRWSWASWWHPTAAYRVAGAG